MKRFIGWLGVLCFLVSVTITQHSDSRAGSVSGLGIEKLGEEKADYMEIAGLEKRSCLHSGTIITWQREKICLRISSLILGMRRRCTLILKFLP